MPRTKTGSPQARTLVWKVVVLEAACLLAAVHRHREEQQVGGLWYSEGVAAAGVSVHPSTSIAVQCQSQRRPFNPAQKHCPAPTCRVVNMMQTDMRSRWLGLQRVRGGGAAVLIEPARTPPIPGPPAAPCTPAQPAAPYHCQRKCVLVRSTRCSHPTMARMSSSSPVPPNRVASYVL